MVIYCDIDGTLTDHSWRIREYGPQAFDEPVVMQDAPWPGAVEALWTLAEDCGPVVYLTARGWPNAQAITAQWLHRCGFVPGCIQTVGNLREKVTFLRGAKHRPAILIDDFMTGHERPREEWTYHHEVVEAIRRLGVEVYRFDGDWPALTRRILSCHSRGLRLHTSD